MINEVNPGTLLHFYRGDNAYFSQWRNRNKGGGWAIPASTKSILPFMIWQDSGAVAVNAFEIVNIDTGGRDQIDTAEIVRKSLDDDSRTWYVCSGVDLVTPIDCGFYVIRVKLGDDWFYSDVLEVKNYAGPEYLTFEVTGCDDTLIAFMTINVTATVATALSSISVKYRLDNATEWTAASLSGSGNSYDFSVLTGWDLGRYYLIQARAITDDGNMILLDMALHFDPSDPCGTYSLIVLEDRSVFSGKDRYILTLSNTSDYNDILYSLAWAQTAFVQCFFDFPEIERQQDIFINGEGEQVIESATTRERVRVVLPRIPDQWRLPLAALNDLDGVTLTSLSTGEVYALQEIDTGFEPSSDGYHTNAILRFRTQKNFRASCLIDEDIYDPA